MPHDVLILHAIRYGYPLWLLRLSLAAYRLQRRVGVAGVYGSSARASRGITAGSGFACVELRLVLLRMIKDTYRVYPWIKDFGWMWIYVDDITILWVSSTWDMAADVCAAITDHIVKWLSGPLRLVVSPNKCFVVGTKLRTAVRVAKVMISSLTSTLTLQPVMISSPTCN